MDPLLTQFRVSSNGYKNKINKKTFENPWGGLNFSKMSELKVTLRPHQKKEKLEHLMCPFSM